MSTIYDAFGRPRFYFVDRAVYEHGGGRLINIDPSLPRGPNYGLPAWWIDGVALDPQLRGQQFYYDAEEEPPVRDETPRPERDRAHWRRVRQGKRRFWT